MGNSLLRLEAKDYLGKQLDSILVRTGCSVGILCAFITSVLYVSSIIFLNGIDG